MVRSCTPCGVVPILYCIRLPQNLCDVKHVKKRVMEKYRCTVCDWVYDPAAGDPESGVAPGTAFEDIPEDWVCPVCGVGKDQFEKVG